MSGSIFMIRNRKYQRLLKKQKQLTRLLNFQKIKTKSLIKLNFLLINKQLLLIKFIKNCKIFKNFIKKTLHFKYIKFKKKNFFFIINYLNNYFYIKNIFNLKFTFYIHKLYSIYNITFIFK